MSFVVRLGCRLRQFLRLGHREQVIAVRAHDLFHARLDGRIGRLALELGELIEIPLVRDEISERIEIVLVVSRALEMLEGGKLFEQQTIIVRAQLRRAIVRDIDPRCLVIVEIPDDRLDRLPAFVVGIFLAEVPERLERVIALEYFVRPPRVGAEVDDDRDELAIRAQRRRDRRCMTDDAAGAVRPFR